MGQTIGFAICVLLAMIGPATAQDPFTTLQRADLGARSYDAACSACHYRGAGKTPFGNRGPVADDSPDGLVQFILFGKAPEDDEGGMPAFGAVLTNADVTRIAVWLRSVARPEMPWADVAASVTRMRTSGQRED